MLSLLVKNYSLKGERLEEINSSVEANLKYSDKERSKIWKYLFWPVWVIFFIGFIEILRSNHIFGTILVISSLAMVTPVLIAELARFNLNIAKRNLKLLMETHKQGRHS